MKVIKFENGKFGIVSGWFTKYFLQNPKQTYGTIRWWHEPKQVRDFCEFDTKEEAQEFMQRYKFKDKIRYTKA